MTFQFTEDQLSIQEMVRTYSEKEIRPRAEEIDKTGRFPKENMDGLRELGILQLTIPEEYGGTGIDDEITKALAVMEVAKCCASTAEILDVHYLSTDILMRKGTAEQKAKYLPQAAEGKLGGFALTEPDAGSDAGGLKTKAVKDGGDYILNGTKCFISNLGPEEGNHFVVVAVTEPGIGTQGTTAFLVDRSMPGVSCGKTEDKMGIRGAAVSELVLEDVRVPSSAILGKLGEGFKIAMMTLDGGRIGIAAQALGLGEGAVNEAVKYTQERVQFKKRLSQFQNTQFQLADMHTRMQAAQYLVYAAAMKKQNHEPYSMDAAMAKLFAAESASDVTRRAVQLFGGYGYTREYPVERMMRDAKITEIYEGTSEVQRMVISSHLGVK